jgi:hypothetical protein
VIDTTAARAWLLAEARRLQAKQERMRRRLDAVRDLMRIVCDYESRPGMRASD